MVIKCLVYTKILGYLFPSSFQEMEICWDIGSRNLVENSQPTTQKWQIGECYIQIMNIREQLSHTILMPGDSKHAGGLLGDSVG